jgi:hypothetical protein
LSHSVHAGPSVGTGRSVGATSTKRQQVHVPEGTRLRRVRRLLVASVGLLRACWVYRLVARGSLTIDTGIGRRLRQLGPARFQIAAPQDVVFDVIATPYLGRTPRALQSELAVWERGSDIGSRRALHPRQVRTDDDGGDGPLPSTPQDRLSRRACPRTARGRIVPARSGRWRYTTDLAR